MAKSKCTKLVILHEDSARLREFRLSRAKKITYLSIAVLLIGALVVGVSQLFAEKMTQAAMARVVDENRELRQQLVRINDRLVNIDEQLGDLFENDDKLRLLADMEQIDEDVRQVGIGGAVFPTHRYSDDDASVRKVIFDLDKIEREIKLQRTSFVEIERQLKEKSDLVAHTPSIRPVEGGFVSSRFGRRRDPFTRNMAHHNGIDISMERGTPVYCAADGKVVFAKRTPGLGNLVIIDHGYGFRTAYGHLDRITITKGQTVERWQKLGEVGNTGRSTAPHLHYEVHVDRKAVDPVDYMFDDFAVRFDG